MLAVWRRSCGGGTGLCTPTVPRPRRRFERLGPRYLAIVQIKEGIKSIKLYQIRSNHIKINQINQINQSIERPKNSTFKNKDNQIKVNVKNKRYVPNKPSKIWATHRKQVNRAGYLLLPNATKTWPCPDAVSAPMSFSTLFFGPMYFVLYHWYNQCSPNAKGPDGSDATNAGSFFKNIWMVPK